MTDLSSTNGIQIYSEAELKQIAPSVYSTAKDPRRSDKYSFLPTNKILEVIEEKGWSPKYARQQGRTSFARHMIRLENPKFSKYNLGQDSLTPQLLIDNSHNGKSSAKVHLGIFRLVCSNGLIVGAPGLSTSFKFKHIGLNKSDIFETIEEATEQFDLVINHVDEMKNISLTKDQIEEFAIRAISLRNPRNFINEDGTIKTENVLSKVNIKDIYTPTRSADDSNDLWSVFNVIQEKTVNGLFEFQNGKRTRKARPISQVKKNFKYNKALWETAETYMAN
jgi:hypothetical protein